MEASKSILSDAKKVLRKKMRATETVRKRIGRSSDGYVKRNIPPAKKRPQNNKQVVAEPGRGAGEGGAGSQAGDESKAVGT
jgi:hypothetical protein